MGQKGKGKVEKKNGKLGKTPLFCEKTRYAPSNVGNEGSNINRKNKNREVSSSKNVNIFMLASSYGRADPRSTRMTHHGKVF